MRMCNAEIIFISNSKIYGQLHEDIQSVLKSFLRNRDLAQE